jgi:hypothetical protein
MKRIALGTLAGIFGLSGCTTLLPEPNATVNVDAITFAILTELYCAAKSLPGDGQPPYFASNDYWIAQIDMYLSASIEASANPLVSLLGPFNLAKATPVGGSTGSFTAGLAGTFDSTRTNLREYKIYVYLKRLVNGNTGLGSNKTTESVPDWATFAESNHWPVHCESPNAGGTYLQGRLGLKDWLEPAVRTQVATVGFAPLNAPPPTPAPPVPPAPTISDVYPDKGTKGDQVFITGANFNKVTNVFFDHKTPTIIAASPTRLVVSAPAPSKVGPVEVVVRTPAGDATGTFTYQDSTAAEFTRRTDAETESDKKVAETTASAPAPPPSSSQQSPTVSGTFTFIIKATGTIGPSFTLSRVSGGGSSLFTMTRTDNSYVNIVLTAATYCPLSTSIPAPATCFPTKGTASQPNSDQIANAITRLDNANLNLNLTHIVAP